MKCPWLFLKAEQLTNMLLKCSFGEKNNFSLGHKDEEKFENEKKNNFEFLLTLKAGR